MVPKITFAPVKGPLLKLLWPEYRRYWKLLGMGVLFVALVNALALYIPWATGGVIDTLWAIQKARAFGEVVPTLGWLLGSMLLASLVRGALMVGMRQTLVVLSRRIERDQRETLIRHLLEWDLRTVERFSVGELMTYFTEDLNRIRNFTGPAVLYGLNAFFLLVFTSVLMLYTSPALAIAALLPLVFLPPLTYYLRQRALALGLRQQAEYAKVSGFLQQVLPYLRALRALSVPAFLERQYGRLSELHRRASLSVARTEAYLQPLTYLFVGLSMTIILLFGGYRVIRGEETLGTVGAFSLYLIQLLFPLGAVGWLMSLYQQAQASAERLLALLAQKGTSLEPKAFWIKKPDLLIAWRWENLGYAYPHAAQTGAAAFEGSSQEPHWVFRGLRGALAAGQHVVLAAPLASGKTTLARLLVRQMDPTEGRIWLADKDLRQYSSRFLREKISYVPQEPVLFEGTLADNLRWVAPQASRRELWRALEWAGLSEEVQSLPKGLLTPIGEWGQRVSGGQRQRLALAMGLLRAPQALILDDIFAPLDSEKIVEILHHLQKHFGHLTWLLISHRTEVRPYGEVWWPSLSSAFTLQKEG